MRIEKLAMLLLLVAGCAVKRPQPVYAPLPHARPAMAATSPPEHTITLAWDYEMDPEITFNLYTSSDLAQWNFLLNTPFLMVTVPMDQPHLFFSVTATNTVSGLESASAWNH